MIYVTENGVSEKMLCTDLCDDWRMKYFKDYINEMLKGKTTNLLNTYITKDFNVRFLFSLKFNMTNKATTFQRSN